MTEVQSALIAPILRFSSIPHVLWYAHTSKSLYLLWNNFFVNNIVTSTQGSCPLRNRKVIPIGQAIDDNKFIFPIKHVIYKKKFVHIGRLDPSKNIQSIIDIVTKFHSKDSGISLNLVGSSSSLKTRQYELEIKSNNSIKSFITFQGVIPRIEIPRVLYESDAFIHCFYGSLDKTLIEATMVGIPVISPNREYVHEFGSWSNVKLDDVTLESELEAFFEMSEQNITENCLNKQNYALTHHSYAIWEKRLITLFDDLIYS